MRRITKMVAIVIVGIVAVTYGAYALEYRGNYNVTATFILSQPIFGQPQVTNVAFTSEPTGMLQFWDGLRGHGGGGGITIGYKVFAEIQQDSLVVSKTTGMGVKFDGTSEEFPGEIQFVNISPGESTVRIYVEDVVSGSIVFDHSYDLVVG